MGQFITVDAIDFIGDQIEEHWTSDQVTILMARMVKHLTTEQWMQIRRARMDSMPNKARPNSAFPMQGIHAYELMDNASRCQAAPQKERPKYMKNPPIYEPNS